MQLRGKVPPLPVCMMGPLFGQNVYISIKTEVSENPKSNNFEIII